MERSQFDLSNIIITIVIKFFTTEQNWREARWFIAIRVSLIIVTLKIFLLEVIFPILNLQYLQNQLFCLN